MKYLVTLPALVVLVLLAAALAFAVDHHDVSNHFRTVEVFADSDIEMVDLDHLNFGYHEHLPFSLSDLEKLATLEDREKKLLSLKQEVGKHGISIGRSLRERPVRDNHDNIDEKIQQLEEEIAKLKAKKMSVAPKPVESEKMAAEKSAAPKNIPKIVPNFAHQSPGEKKYPKLHKCRDSGEAYGAAYLISKEHLIYQDTGYNLTWVNCEMGSFIMMNGRANPQRDDINGTIIQTLDVLDFSVIHLSAYERLHRRWQHSMPREVAQKGSIEPVSRSAEYLKTIAEEARKQPPALPQYNRTVVIMPFLGSDMGAGHSKLNNRLQYLHACFWSMYRYIPNIVAMVKSEKDWEFAKKSSGLPFFDVVLASGLPKSASLPVATVQHCKKFIMDGTWDFDYVLFTESDQILMMRNADVLYNHLVQYPRRIIIPHRLMPYPEPVLSFFHKRPVHAIQYDRKDLMATSYKPGGKNLTESFSRSMEVPKGVVPPTISTEDAYISGSPGGGPQDWMKMNCCLTRQNCVDRKGWLHVRNPQVPIINAFGLQVPLGNTNFHEETYRHCELNVEGTWPLCP